MYTFHFPPGTLGLRLPLLGLSLLFPKDVPWVLLFAATTPFLQTGSLTTRLYKTSQRFDATVYFLFVPIETSQEKVKLNNCIENYLGQFLCHPPAVGANSLRTGKIQDQA